jgi:hypothetical protein
MTDAAQTASATIEIVVIRKNGTVEIPEQDRKEATDGSPRTRHDSP